MADENDNRRTDDSNSASGRTRSGDASSRRHRRGSSWVDKIYDIIDERIGDAMKRLSE